MRPASILGLLAALQWAPSAAIAQVRALTHVNVVDVASGTMRDMGSRRDITNVRRIRAVARAGVYDRRALDALLWGVEQASRPSAALERWENAVATNTNSPDEWYAVGQTLYGARRYREAVAAFERGLTLRATGSSDEAWYIARAYAQLGNRKQALRWLTHAQQLGFKDELAVNRDPAFDKYRGDLRFRGS